MPRDGAQNYSVPGGTDGVPDTPVLSTPYNGFLRDLEQDLNTPRPILAGGTGATNARDALINLGAETSNQGPVTNYADYPFLPGSFYSNVGATDAPPTGLNATEIFVGICFGLPGVSLTIECYGYNSHVKYFRSQVAGVWSAWVTLVTSQPDADARYVNVTGDVMTGDLVMTRAVTGFPAQGFVIYGDGTGPGGPQYFGSNGTNLFSGTNIGLPATPPPAVDQAVRRDFMEAADAALKADYDAKIAVKADASALPQAASVAEFRANSAPTKMLTPGAVWGAAGYNYLAYGQQIDMSTGFDFYIPGGPIHNPANPKMGQKGVLWLHSNPYNWGTSWKFPNSVKPAWSGGYDVVSYAVYDANTIWCVHLPAMG